MYELTKHGQGIVQNLEDRDVIPAIADSNGEEDTWGLCNGLIQDHYTQESSIVYTVLEKIYTGDCFEPCVEVIDMAFDDVCERNQYISEWVSADRLCDYRHANWTIDTDVFMDTVDAPSGIGTIDVISRARVDCMFQYVDPKHPYVIDIDAGLISVVNDHDVVCGYPTVSIMKQSD